MTHGTKLQGLPSRPDKHVVFTIILPLLQVRPPLPPPLRDTQSSLSLQYSTVWE